MLMPCAQISPRGLLTDSAQRVDLLMRSRGMTPVRGRPESTEIFPGCDEARTFYMLLYNIGDQGLETRTLKIPFPT